LKEKRERENRKNVFLILHIKGWKLIFSSRKTFPFFSGTGGMPKEA
jgi:hypothetical protein